MGSASRTVATSGGLLTVGFGDADSTFSGGVSGSGALAKVGLGTLVLDGDRLLNPELRRFPDEFVRHKILDAIGDLALCGAPLLARYAGRRPSHALNNRLLAALFAHDDFSNTRL